MADPVGAVVLVMSPDGDVVGAGTSFDLDGYSSFSLAEAQKMRARDRAWSDALDKMTAPRLFDCLSSYVIDRLYCDLRKYEQGVS